MMNKIKQIEAMMLVCYNNLRLERLTYKTSWLCQNYEIADETRYFAKEKHQEAIESIVELINETLDYPIEKWLFLSHQDQATYKIHKHGWDGHFLGYRIEIPYIDKKEYYCIIQMFKKAKKWGKYLSNDNQWVIRNDI